MENMNTISIDKNVYKWAEGYAKIHHISMDKLAEQALLMLVGRPKAKYTLKTEDELSPAVQSLIGIAKPTHANEDINGRDARMEYLTKKYEL